MRQDDGAGAVTRKLSTHTLSTGEQIILHQLTFKDFELARQAALDEYQRQQIRVWTKNVDLMPVEERAGWVRDAFSRASKIRISDLPDMPVKMPKTDEAGEYVLDEHGDYVLEESVQQYAAWWMAQTPQGQVFMIWRSMVHAPSQKDMTLEQANELFTRVMAEGTEDLEHAAQRVGELSETQLETSGKSNSPPSREGKPLTARERRRRRRIQRAARSTGR